MVRIQRIVWIAVDETESLEVIGGGGNCIMVSCWEIVYWVVQAMITCMVMRALMS